MKFSGNTHNKNLAEAIGMIGTSLIVGIIVLAGLILTPSCSGHDSAYDNMPTKISQFVARYFPGYAVDQYTAGPDALHVRLKNGPGITFDSNQNLEAVNGYGETLPQMMLFDTLPPALFDYLQSAENLNNVFSVTFSPRHVVVVLLETTLSYDTATGKITDTETPNYSPGRLN